MALDYVSFAAQSFKFGTQTWDNSDGGIMDFEYDKTGETLKTHVGGGLYAQNVEVIKALPAIKVTISDLAPTALPTLGDLNDPVVVYLKAGRVEATKNYYRMKFTGVTQTQAQHAEGTSSLNFEYECDDTGILDPETAGA